MNIVWLGMRLAGCSPHAPLLLLAFLFISHVPALACFLMKVPRLRLFWIS